jgi:glutaredoxin
MKKVRLYGFEGCPYCDELKDLFDDGDINYDYIDIDLDENQDEIKKVMEIGKTTSVPIVIVKKVILSPEISFKSIPEAYETTKRLLSEDK